MAAHESARTHASRSSGQIRDLDYVPNRAARSLVTRRTDSIGLVIPEPTTKLFDDPYFPRLVRGIGEVLGAADQQLILLTPQSPADELRLATYLTSGHVDGVLLVSLHGHDPLPAALAARGVPVVVGGRPADGGSLEYVDVDNVHGALSAVRHLIDGGRRRIATITGSTDMTVADDRLEGYRRAHREAGLAVDPRLELDGRLRADAGTHGVGGRACGRAGRRCRVRGIRPDGTGRPRRPPTGGPAGAGGRGRGGFRRLTLAVSTDPGLSSVRQPIEEMGREMARAILASSRGEPRVARNLLLATELIVRGSSGY